MTRIRPAATIVAATAVLALGVSACSSSGGSTTSNGGGSGSTAAGATGSSGTGGSGGTINLVAYSVPKPAYDALATAFAATSAGKGVTVNASYGPSGTQSKNVLSGQAKADFVNFSTGSDLTKLVPSKVASDWNTGPTKGIIADSVVVIVVRKGNPKKITGWDDLVKPGIKIVTPTPETSGSAKWNILAAYQHVIDEGKSASDAETYLKAFYKNIVSHAESGSAATQQFLNGTGDVLISYEAEAIAAKQKGASLDYIVPAQTMLIETPAAVTTTANQAAKDFLTFAESADGQKIFAGKGFRPAVQGVDPGTVEGANDPSNPFPQPSKLDTITELGGWSAVNTKFFDADNGLVTKIENG
ncbi:MAG: extracellular solute-binding protein [Jatrophihabitans sp.]|uniref:extracellular solute-binding protein n=1 Tax=Jatrophihabitans sp. TaxID=1932789 RepID=UPI003F7F1F17